MRNAKELLRTCAGLEKLGKRALERGAFNMEYWRGYESPKKPKKMTCECGFSGCFIGWHPVFNPKSKLGLGNYYRAPQTYTEEGPTYGFPAIEAHFGITRSQAERLFGYDAYRNPRNPLPVIRRVRAFVKKHTGKRK